MRRDQSIMEFQQTVGMMNEKVRKLEQLVELKDKRIEGMFIECLSACRSHLLDRTDQETKDGRHQAVI